MKKSVKERFIQKDQIWGIDNDTLRVHVPVQFSKRFEIECKKDNIAVSRDVTYFGLKMKVHAYDYSVKKEYKMQIIRKMREMYKNQ